MIERLSKVALAAGLALLLAASSAPSFAGPAEDEARSRQLFNKATELANHGQFAEACPLFQQAHDLHGTGGTALRTADCYEKTGKYEDALRLYQYIVDHKDTDKQPERVALAEGRVAALKKQLAPEPAATGIATSAPAATAIATSAPTAASIATSGPIAPSAPTAMPPPVKTARPRSKTLGYWFIGAGGGGGLFLGGLALAGSIINVNRVKDGCDLRPTLCPLEKEHNDAVTDLILSELAFGAAVASVVTGAVLLATRSSPKAQQAVQKAIGPGGVTFHF